ncbi:hypothetical protein Tco_1452454 [Tanacetum coccineum]
MKLFSTFMFSEAIVDIDVVGTLQFQLGGAKRHMSQFILALGLHIAEEMETTGFGVPPSYTHIRDPMLRLCHRYLRMFASGRKRRAKIYGGQFICEELDDTWAWVAPGPKRQPDVMAGAPEVTGGAPDIAEGAQAIPSPV